MKTDLLVVNGKEYSVKIFVENRKDTAVRIGKKAVTIRIPYFLNRDESAKEILRMKVWAKNKLLELPDLLNKDIKRNYCDGDRIRVGDEEYILNISFKDNKCSSARLEDRTIMMNISSDLSEEMRIKHVSSLLSRCVARKRIGSLKSKINELNLRHFNQRFNKVFFKNNRSNWGSCSASGNINISTRLLFAPNDVLEYVCIHELAHLIEKNHSQNFWVLVEKAMPDFREKERWLKENGKNCNF